MLACGEQILKRKTHPSRAAFTLVELLVSIVIMAMVSTGLIFGYVQANRFAEWSSMSLAAQSYALQGLEQVRAAKWDTRTTPIWDDIHAPTNYIQTDLMDVPVTGAPFSVTNYITLTQVSDTPPLRMIRSDCVWIFPRTGQIYTNSVVTYRAPDQS